MRRCHNHIWILDTPWDCHRTAAPLTPPGTTPIGRNSRQSVMAVPDWSCLGMDSNEWPDLVEPWNRWHSNDKPQTTVTSTTLLSGCPDFQTGHPDRRVLVESVGQMNENAFPSNLSMTQQWSVEAQELCPNPMYPRNLKLQTQGFEGELVSNSSNRSGTSRRLSAGCLLSMMTTHWMGRTKPLQAL